MVQRSAVTQQSNCLHGQATIYREEGHQADLNSDVFTSHSSNSDDMSPCSNINYNHAFHHQESAQKARGFVHSDGYNVEVEGQDARGEVVNKNTNLFYSGDDSEVGNVL